MKKILLTILLGAFGTMAIAASAFAATSVSFAPANVSVRQGQTFTLTIGVNPQGTKSYTAKTELRFPADLLEVKSFAFATGWMPLSQSGYDLTDNTNGVLIKTAGYPGGLSAPVTFGTVLFLAKKSGNGTITLSNNSFMLDATNQNVLSGASVQTAVMISAPAPTPTAPKVSAPALKKTQPTVQTTQETPIVQEESIAETKSTSSEPVASQSLLATIGNTITLGTDSTIVGILVVIAILTLIGYAVYVAIKRLRLKNLGKPQ